MNGDYKRPIRMSLDKMCRGELDRLDKIGLRRRQTVADELAASTMRVGPDDLIVMCSNDYLGLRNDRRLCRAAAQASQQWGYGGGASRLISGSTRLHAELERKVAAWKGCEDAVVFSSGYLANVGTISALVGRNDTIVSDALNHASIIDGCRLSGGRIDVYPHADVDACNKLVTEASKRRDSNVLVVTDGIFSMDGDRAPLRALTETCSAHGAWLMVDDAHGTGVVGPDGAGTIAQAGVDELVDVSMGTFSKALGAAGGFVAGSHDLCEFLRNRARTYVYDTAPPIPTVAATICALDIAVAERERATTACRHAKHLAADISELGYNVAHPEAAIVSVVIGATAAAVEAAMHLRSEGIFAPAIRPPTVPTGTARIRLCPTASHTAAEIERVIAAFDR